MINSENKMWGVLLHLSFNMWCDNEIEYPTYNSNYLPKLRCDKEIWDEAISLMAECGLNTVVIDLGDGVQYKSHPEIAVEGAWTVEELKIELDRIRSLGITPLPKLNFSTGHDAWLGEYSRMVSTQTYYTVCKDLIEEVCDIFDTPQFFHLGLDEEGASHQVAYSTINARSGKQLWNDLKFYFDTVKGFGVTPWIWHDYYSIYPEDFEKNVSKDVMISPWFYWKTIEDPYGSNVLDDSMREARDSIAKINQAGYKQIPCGSNWAMVCNIEDLVKYCKETIDEDKLNGFLMTSWEATILKRKYSILEAIDLLRWAKKDFEEK